jgi:hypothetical protein
VPLRYIPVHDKYFPIRKRPNMIWPAALSTFMLNRVCELVTEEKARVPLFRNRDLKAICVAQVYNHLMHWRSRRVHVCKMNKMERVRWV